MSKRTENRGASHRLARVEREIRDVVSVYLLGGFRGELPGMVSVTRVGTSSDLRSARIFVILILNQEPEETAEAFATRTKKQRKVAVDELNAHTHEIQTEIARKLQMRFTPKVTFAYDDGYDNAMKVERILRDIGQSRASSETSQDASQNASQDASGVDGGAGDDE